MKECRDINKVVAKLLAEFLAKIAGIQAIFIRYIFCDKGLSIFIVIYRVLGKMLKKGGGW